MPTRVIVLAGPSGSGKSRLAERLGIPILRLDDFYRDHDAEGLPLITEGANAGMVDWDDAAAWDQDAAMRAMEDLCRTGTTTVPVYSIPLSRRTGETQLDLGEHAFFAAEGIFAPEVVADCSRAGILEAAYCIAQHPLVTFWRRLKRDLEERRKAPLVLVRRGWALAKAQRSVVASAVAKGCRAATPKQAYAELAPTLGHSSQASVKR